MAWEVATTGRVPKFANLVNGRLRLFDCVQCHGSSVIADGMKPQLKAKDRPLHGHLVELILGVLGQAGVGGVIGVGGFHGRGSRA